MLRLLGRNWVALLLWFVAARAVHDLLMIGAAWVGQRQKLLGLSVLSLAVLAVLAGTILMLYSVRGSLPSLRRGAGSYTEPEGGATGGLAHAVAETILPFLIFYSAWGLFTEEARDYTIEGVNQAGLGESSGFVLNFGDDWHALLIPLAVAAATWGVRAVCEFFHNRTGSRVLAVATAVLEANWMLFFVAFVGTVLGQATSWLTGRVFWHRAGDAIGGAVHAADRFLDGLALPQVSEAWQWLAGYLPDLRDGLLLPILWLTIAAVIYGEEVTSDGRLVSESHRLSRIADRTWARLPGRARTASDVLSREWRDKYVPFVNGLKLVLRGGAAFYLVFCLMYVLLKVATDWAWIGATQLIGAHAWTWWWVRLPVLNFLRDGTYEVLRICLLAAAFDLTLRRIAATGRARTARATPPGPSAVPTASRPSAPGT